jgi:hypothetical protein
MADARLYRRARRVPLKPTGPRHFSGIRTSIDALRVEPFRRLHARKTPFHLHCRRICDVGGCHGLGAKRSRFAEGGFQPGAAVSTANYGSPGPAKSPGCSERAGAAALGHHHRSTGCTWRARPRRSQRGGRGHGTHRRRDRFSGSTAGKSSSTGMRCISDASPTSVTVSRSN